MSAAHHNHPDRLNRRWDLIAIGIVVNTCLGTVYSWSVFREPLETALNIGPAESGIPYSAFLAGFAFSMPLGGLLIGRMGSRPTLLTGGVLVGIGWLSAGLFETFWMVTVAYGIVGGVGVGLAYGVPLAVVGSWFPDRRGFAMGLTLIGFGVSPFVTAPVAGFLIALLGVQGAMVALGATFVPVISILSLFMIPRAQAQLGTTDPGSTMDLDIRQMVRTGRFYGLWGCYVIGTLAGLTAIGMTASFGRQVVALSAPTAAASVALFAVMNGVGRPLFGSFHDRLGTRRTVVLAFVIITMGAAVSLLAGEDAIVAYYLGFAILWLILGGWLAIAPAATILLFGTRHYAANYGVMYTAYGVGALAGGAASGALFEAFGSYRPVLLLIAALAMVGLVIAVTSLRGNRHDRSGALLRQQGRFTLR